MTPPMNPDCRVGKHAACAGDAWDEQTDAPAPCGCPCHTTTPVGRVPVTPDPSTRKVTGL